LHHKFFDLSLRDLFDLEFILKKSMPLDWNFVESYCRQEYLYKHLVLTAQLSQDLLRGDWIHSLTGRKKLPRLQKWTLKGLFFLNKNKVLWLEKNSGVGQKLGDFFILFWVYDHFLAGFTCFLNKYVLYVLPRRLWKGVFQAIFSFCNIFKRNKSC